jgi:TP901-1 family phage major tail protein
MRGVDVLIKVNTGTEAVPVWTAVGGQRGATLSEEYDTVDTTTKDGGGWKEFDLSTGGWTISCDGVLVDGDVGYAALKTAMRSRSKVQVQIINTGPATDVELEEGEGWITSHELDMPYDDNVTYAVEIQGTGPLSAA